MSKNEQEQCLIVLDTETGGLDSKKHAITQIAYEILTINTLSPKLKYSQYVQNYNGLQYDDKALEKTGITYDNIMNGKTVHEVCNQLINDLNECTPNYRKKPILVGHNIAFDIAFLEEMFRFCKKDISASFANSNGVLLYYDTLLLAKMKWSGDPNTKYDLTSCCMKAGIEIVDAHKADTDIEAARDLYSYFMQSIKQDAGNQTVKVERFRDYYQF